VLLAAARGEPALLPITLRIRSTRRAISAVARREKVISRILRRY
jgi:hypothetical protein